MLVLNERLHCDSASPKSGKWRKATLGLIIFVMMQCTCC